MKNLFKFFYVAAFEVSFIILLGAMNRSNAESNYTLSVDRAPRVSISNAQNSKGEYLSTKLEVTVTEGSGVETLTINNKTKDTTVTYKDLEDGDIKTITESELNTDNIPTKFSISATDDDSYSNSFIGTFEITRTGATNGEEKYYSVNACPRLTFDVGDGFSSEKETLKGVSVTIKDGSKIAKMMVTDINSGNLLITKTPEDATTQTYDLDLSNATIKNNRLYLKFYVEDKSGMIRNENIYIRIIESKMHKLIERAKSIAKSNKCLYSQAKRDQNTLWHPTKTYSTQYFDCSSLVYGLYKYYYNTSSMPKNTASYGSKYRVGKTSKVTLKVGDVLWRSGHVALYIGSGKYVAAHGVMSNRKNDITIYKDSKSNYTYVYRFAK